MLVEGSFKQPKPTQDHLLYAKACRKHAKHAAARRRRVMIAVAAWLLVMTLGSIAGCILAVVWYLEAKKTNEALQEATEWFYCSYMLFTDQCYVDPNVKWPTKKTTDMINMPKARQLYGALYEDVTGLDSPSGFDCPTRLATTYSAGRFNEIFESATHFQSTGADYTTLHNFFGNDCVLSDT